MELIYKIMKLPIMAPMQECPECISLGKLCSLHYELEEKKNDRYYKKIMNTKATNNWRPVVGSLLKKLQAYGFTLVSVDDGGETHHLTGTNREQRQQAKAAVCAVDESHLYVDTSEGVQKWLYIVLGNAPEELVADCSGSGLDEVLEEFSKQWEGVKCPTV